MFATDGSLVVHVVLDKIPYAIDASVCALIATVPPADIVPITFPGGKPTIAEPGLVPRFPMRRLLPVLVTVEELKTAKLLADPRSVIADVAKALFWTMIEAESISTTITK